MKLRDLSVRHRLLINNIIMVLVPVLLLAGIGSIIFHGLRATGSFREREMEILCRKPAIRSLSCWGSAIFSLM